jgi:hypothetical protein
MKQKKLQITLTAVCAFLTLSGTAQTVSWLSRPEFLSVMPFSNKLYKVNTYNYQAVVNGRGKTVTTADSITFLTNGYALALAQFGDRYLLKGIINREGGFTQFRGEYYATEKSFFSEDKCLVVNKKGKFGYIDPAGNVIINCNYQSAEPFRGGAAYVMKPKKGGLIKVTYEEGYINARGEDHKAPSPDAPDPILTANKPFKPTYNTTYSVYEENGKKGYMVNGDILLPAQLEEAGLFADGQAIVKMGGKYGILQYLSGSIDCKVIENSGRLDVSAIIPPAWDDKEARFVRISKNGQRLSLSMVGLRSMRSLTADVPIEDGSHQYELSVDGLTIWKGQVTSSKTGKTEPRETKGRKRSGNKDNDKSTKKDTKKDKGDKGSKKGIDL